MSVRVRLTACVDVAANQIIKLPANKYTVREREMLQGTANAPAEFFAPGNAFSNSIILGKFLLSCAMESWETLLWDGRATLASSFAGFCFRSNA